MGTSEFSSSPVMDYYLIQGGVSRNTLRLHHSVETGDNHQPEGLLDANTDLSTGSFSLLSLLQTTHRGCIVLHY